MKTYLWQYWSSLCCWCKRENGQTLVEYGLILVLISITLFAVLFAFRDSLVTIFGKVTATLSIASGS